MLKIFLAGGVISTISLHSIQEKMTFIQENSATNQILHNQPIDDTDDNNTRPIMCDKNDEEVCEYIEQQKESALRIWLRELEIILFLKLIHLRECLDKYKKTLYKWIKKLIVMPY